MQFYGHAVVEARFFRWVWADDVGVASPIIFFFFYLFLQPFLCAASLLLWLSGVWGFFCSVSWLCSSFIMNEAESGGALWCGPVAHTHPGEVIKKYWFFRLSFHSLAACYSCRRCWCRCSYWWWCHDVLPPATRLDTSLRYARCSRPSSHCRSVGR